MKKQFLWATIAAVFIYNCQEPKNYVELSGLISHPTSDQITISSREGYSKVISVNSDGTFSDTLNVVEGRYRFSDGQKMGAIFLKNGNSTSFNVDTKSFYESLKFEGDDANKSNVLAEYAVLQNKYLSSVMESTEDEFENSFSELKSEFDALKSKYNSIEPTYFEEDDKNFKLMKSSMKQFFDQRIAIKKELPKGIPSPVFTNYENYSGGTNSLEDFRGKFVYIDVWATWCAPCLAEVPFLKKLETKMHNRNIEFLSISVDDATTSGSFEKAREDWKKTVKEKELSGVQLFSSAGRSDEFLKAYKVMGIPRFILIDPQGNIIDPDAPRPSNKDIVKLLEELGV